MVPASCGHRVFRHRLASQRKGCVGIARKLAEEGEAALKYSQENQKDSRLSEKQLQMQGTV